MTDNDLSIQCDIEAPGPFRLGKPLHVKGTLRNTGAKPAWLLTQSTFLNPHADHCLTLTHDDEFVTDVEIPAARTPTDAEDDNYFRMDPGQAMSLDLDLAESYQLGEAGDYELSLRMPLYGVVERVAGVRPPSHADYQFRFIQSESLTLAIKGDPAAPAVPHVVPSNMSAPVQAGPEFPDKPMTPIFLGMTPDQRDAYAQAHLWAYQSIIAALQEARAPRLFHYSRWMEYFDEAVYKRGPAFLKRREIVIGNLKKMAKWMSARQVTYEKCDGPPCKNSIFDGVFAWTYRNSNQNISLCAHAFNDHQLRFEYARSAPWARAFLVVHEVSHAAADTEDTRYVMSECDVFATRFPHQAVRNAQNYAYFAMYSLDSPPEAKADKGMWEVKTVPVAWRVSPAGVAAAAIASKGVVMIVYQDVASTMDGVLWHKVLLAGGRTEQWLDAQQMKLGDGGEICKSAYAEDRPARPTPALAGYTVGSSHVFACAYVERSSKALVLVETRRLDDPSHPADFSQLTWKRVDKFHAQADAHPVYGPALAWHEGRLFCAYVGVNGRLHCVRETPDGFEQVDMGDQRTVLSAPSLAVFDGELRCSYLNLNGIQIICFQNGRWTGTDLPVTQGMQTMAIAQWDTDAGPRLLALGKTSGKATLTYAVSNGDRSRSIDKNFFRHTVVMQDGGPMGGALAALGTTVHGFYRRDDERLEHVVIEMPHPIGMATQP